MIADRVSMRVFFRPLISTIILILLVKRSFSSILQATFYASKRMSIMGSRVTKDLASNALEYTRGTLSIYFNEIVEK